MDIQLVSQIEGYKTDLMKKKLMKDKLEKYYNTCNLHDKLILSSSNLPLYEKMKLKLHVNN